MGPETAAEAEKPARPDTPVVRAADTQIAALELRAADPGTAGDGEPAAMPTLHGHFAVFNRWTEIDSYFEGNFMERFAPGAFKKTFREQRDRMRVLFQHGRDSQIGDKPLGPIADLREDGEGAYYEVPLLDTDYNRELIPGLEAGLYGASFRFRVVREEVNTDPGESADNPKGLPERTIREAQVMEFGPVTFPAYDAATAGVRSLTDDFIVMQMGGTERMRSLLDRMDEAAATGGEQKTTTDAPSERAAADQPHRTDERRDHPTSPTGPVPLYGTRQETPSWIL